MLWVLAELDYQRLYLLQIPTTQTVIELEIKEFFNSSEFMFIIFLIVIHLLLVTIILISKNFVPYLILLINSRFKETGFEHIL